eukprot:jgi/Botrbrau1/3832/Bobra.0183s0058.1
MEDEAEPAHLPPTGGRVRVRNMKTPLQKEALEAAFLINPFPAEEVRIALGNRIGLSEQQVQVWFSHKRRREKQADVAAAAQQALASANPHLTLRMPVLHTPVTSAMHTNLNGATPGSLTPDRNVHGVRPPDSSFRPMSMPVSVVPSREVSVEPSSRHGHEQDALQVSNWFQDFIALSPYQRLSSNMLWVRYH